MKIIRHLLLLTPMLFYYGCVTFKPGQYKPGGEVNSINFVTNIFFYENGTYKCYIYNEYNKRIIESGSWQKSGNKITVSIDSSYDVDGIGRAEHISSIFRNSFLKNRLTVTKILNKKKYTWEWVLIPPIVSEAK